MSILNYEVLMSFDGVDESVGCGELPMNPDGDPAAAKYFSRAMWIKMRNPDVSSLSHRAIWNSDSGANKTQGFQYDAGDGYKAGTRYLGKPIISSAEADDEWHFLALTLKDNYTYPGGIRETRGYFDNTGPVLDEAAELQPLFLHPWNGPPVEIFGEKLAVATAMPSWNGYIGQSAFWDNIALTDADMLTLYAGGNRFSDWSTMESSDLLSYWKMGNGANTDGSPKDTYSTIYDLKGSNHGTTANMDSSNLDKVLNTSLTSPYLPFWQSVDETSNDNSGHFTGIGSSDNPISTNAPQ